MKQFFVLILIMMSLFSFSKKEMFKGRDISKVEIETLVKDSSINVRALEIVDSVGAIYLTSKGELGMLLKPSLFKHVDSIKERPFYHHKLNFRALSVFNDKGFGITIGNPALIFKLDADLAKNKLIYQENHPKAFYDSIDFWNDEEGIAIGDPTDDCMSIIVTRDGGNTWTKLSCDELPKAKEGEAAFAASDTNIAIVGDKTWVATGGKASRILYSPDKGKTWQVFNTPIIQGKETTGIYSIDFYDELNGFAIGGDYIKPDDNIANKIKTTDGGKTWQIVAKGQNPGYRSCV